MTDINTNTTETQDKPANSRPSFKRAKAEPKITNTVDIVAPNVTENEIVVLPQSIVSVSFDTSKLNEITSLIEIKNYVSTLINGNYTAGKEKMNDIRKIDLLLDRKIIDCLVSPEFKSFVHFENAEQATKEAAWNNSVKSSLYR